MKTELPPSSTTTIARLSGLLEVTRLVRSDAGLPTVLAEIARVVKETLGYGTVVVNLYRPDWDDFCVAAVEGDEEARTALLGQTYEPSTWDKIMLPRFERREGAYLIPAGELEWVDMGVRWNPQRPSNLDPDAWQPEDELFVPFRHSDGHMLGVLSVGDPSVGRRPSDEELDVLVAVAGHAALAVQSAQEASEAAQYERALKQLLRVSTSLVGRAWELHQLLQAVCDGIQSALGFQRVSVSMIDHDTEVLVPRAASGWSMDDPVFQVEYRLADVQPLMDPAYEIAGCYLLPSETGYARISPEVTAYTSESNGRGPYAWFHHWLLVPLHDASSATIGLIWADDPIDRLLPSEPRLEALRTFANQAATAIESNEREAKLRLSEEQFRRVFEESPLGMVLIDGQLHIVDVNEAIVRMLGYGREELRGNHVLDVTHPDDAEMERELLERLFAGDVRQYAIEKRCIAKDGELVWVNLTASTVGDAPGRPHMVLRILEDVTERRRVQEELEQAHGVRRNLLKRVVEVAELERRRMAADLHDGPIQRLSALTIRLETAKLAASRHDWVGCTSALHTTQDNLGTEIGRLRLLMKDLRPPVLDERGLVPALGSLAAETEASSRIRVRVSAPPGDTIALDQDRETALYRIAQEALTNVIKHAQASAAWIMLANEGRGVRIEIGDNGRGFDPDAAPADDGHFGLITMRERAEMAGGSLRVESTPGGGTRVRVLVPQGQGGDGA